MTRPESFLLLGKFLPRSGVEYGSESLLPPNSSDFLYSSGSSYLICDLMLTSGTYLIPGKRILL